MNIFINTIGTKNQDNNKGFAYEKYVIDNLHNYYDIKESYLWKYVPDELLIESGILVEDYNRTIKKRYLTRHKNNNYNILIDTGVDIICKLKDETILLVQCKAYSSIISQKHLSGFYRTILDSILLNNDKNKIKGLIVHTSSLSEIITGSFSYKQDVIKELYLPFDCYMDHKKKKNINIFINLNFIITYKINIVIFFFIIIIYYSKKTIAEINP